ncbi:helix-turn-helix domain-containing protein [Streptomyces caeni]|uniref:Helix-turn-helix domain-containing protein n=1 Tax=Streptomyces caeni TaxID=2307231 RepID=A0ABW4IK89_9ACTN
MKIRADIAALLRAGMPESHIAAQLHVSPRTVRATRRALGLPAPKRGGAPVTYASVEDAFRANTAPVDGGHVRWTGYTDSVSGLPVLCYRGRRQTAPRVAFTSHHGREPVGKVRRTCEYEGCIAGAHLADRLIREANQRADAAYPGIFGGLPADHDESTQGT